MKFNTAFASGSTSAAVSFKASGRSTPMLTALSVTSDKAASVVKVYAADNGKTTCQTQSASGQAVLAVVDASSFDVGDVVLIQHADGTVQVRTVDTGGVDTTGANGLTFTANLSTTVPVGAAVYELKQIAQWAVGAASLTLAAGQYGILAATQASPLYILLDGTSACSINAAAITYVD